MLSNLKLGCAGLHFTVIPAVSISLTVPKLPELTTPHFCPTYKLAIFALDAAQLMVRIASWPSNAGLAVVFVMFSDI